MPRLTRFFIKTAMIYLAAALLIGTVLAARTVWTLPPWISGFSPIYFHAFLVGWVTQLIFGVVFWLFPVQDKVRPRGRESLGWATYILLNVGLALRVLAEPMQMARPRPFWGWLLVLSAILQWLAGLGFVINSWRRVQPSPRERLENSKQ